jgi:pantoate--beta-alanine ligase
MSPSVPIVTTVAELRQSIAAARAKCLKIGLVPTMGALHEGHASLVRAAKAECPFVVVSIFVNPAQFGPNEDFAKYPRTLDDDVSLLADCGADLVFAPRSEDVYRPGHGTWVTPAAVADRWEGFLRPGHFRGVATVVLKLLHMAQPDVAYFGQKDFQQAVMLRRMVDDLDVPVTVRLCPTVRQPDGLALSSRNRYLSPAARRRALALWKSLQRAAELVAGGERNAARLDAEIRKVLATADGAQVDYVAIVDPETFEPVEAVSGPTLAALAVRIDGTRLIDNVVLDPNAT